MKAFSLHRRANVSRCQRFGKDKTNCILIFDCLAAKALRCAEQKLAIAINISTTEKSAGGTQICLDGAAAHSGGSSARREDRVAWQKRNRRAYGLWLSDTEQHADMTLWADPQTARLVHVDMTIPRRCS